MAAKTSSTAASEVGFSGAAPLGRLARAGRGEHVYNEVGMLQKFEEICLPGDWAWAETLVVQPDERLGSAVENVDDDLKREVAFYQHTLSAVKQGLSQLEQSKVPFMRPDDYYAEMVKTDAHMLKVRAAARLQIRHRSRNVYDYHFICLDCL